MNRFKMTFSNSGSVQPKMNNFGGSLASIGNAPKIVPAKNMRLNAPMIDRVHNAKPGCSACGKKVA
jgi:hypothetical protein